MKFTFSYRVVLLTVMISALAVISLAEDGHQLWLRDRPALPVSVVSAAHSMTVDLAKQEIAKNWCGTSGDTVTLLLTNNAFILDDGFLLTARSVEARTESGLLYGSFALLRTQRTGGEFDGRPSNPSYRRRILDHWDNLDGSVERGYAGSSLFWRTGPDSLTATQSDRERWKDYARANASVGINGAVLNNVNASARVLSAGYLNRVKAIADVLRPYGIRTYLSVNFSSPALLGGLHTSDPLAPAVQEWWKKKANEIYTLVPDFGGFLVKANSEGQPGPQDFGRTHADGANMLADALQPFGGIVMWRAFVYHPTEKDRARQAYSEFMPLDGQFRDNVIIQVKNGPIDFQPREPFHPLFGAMKRTPVMPELQITQEYLGQSVHAVFLAPMWEEFLRSDTYQAGPGSTVARSTDGALFPQTITAIAGVANTGLDTNWCGHHFAQANWYAFGRLAWSHQLTSGRIAEEWIRLTFGPGDSNDWNTKFLPPVKQMMLQSREAAVNYMMPLGLHHLFAADHHYGPGPWYAPPGVRADWTPPYYHRADSVGIGFDRTKKGSDAVSQYHAPLSERWNDPATCPEEYLLWFHHVPWDFRMKSGRTLWDELCVRYDSGVKQVKEFQQNWISLRTMVDERRFQEVNEKFTLQTKNAVMWKDACILYFQQFSRRPVPAGIAPPQYGLEFLEQYDFRMNVLPVPPTR